MPVTSLAFVAKNPTLVVKEVISVAVIALQKKGQKIMLEEFLLRLCEGVPKVAACTNLGNDMIATSVVDARVMIARALFHLSTITKTSSAPKANTILSGE